MSYVNFKCITCHNWYVNGYCPMSGGECIFSHVNTGIYSYATRMHCALGKALQPKRLGRVSVLTSIWDLAPIMATAMAPNGTFSYQPQFPNTSAQGVSISATLFQRQFLNIVLPVRLGSTPQLVQLSAKPWLWVFSKFSEECSWYIHHVAQSHTTS